MFNDKLTNKAGHKIDPLVVQYGASTKIRDAFIPM